MKSTFQKLAEKIKVDLNIEVNDFHRHYPGIWQRSGGAFVWSARQKNSSHTIGSQWSATYLLKAKKLVLAERANEVWPED